jgi:leader peptidase (prepilin peptidase)/N-methyltransferase
VSWLLLRGRARCCGTRIAARYPLVEVGTAVAFALVAWWTTSRPEGSWPPGTSALPAFLYLAAVSIALALIDVATFRLPFWIVAPSYPVAAALLGLSSLIERDGASALRMLGGAVVLWALYRVLHQVNPNGMGYGDVRLAGVLGLYLAWVGWGVLAVGAFLGFFVGAVGGLLLMLVRRRGASGLKTHIPYGPYMLAGTWLAVVWGAVVADWYLGTAGLAAR